MSRSGGVSSRSAANRAAGPRAAAAAPRRRKPRRETAAGWLVMSFSSERGSGALRQLPQPHGLVQAAGQAELAVRRDGHAPHPVVVAEEPAHLGAALDVPQPHRLVVAAREDALAVGREDGTEQLLRVPLQLTLLAGGQL